MPQLLSITTMHCDQPHYNHKYDIFLILSLEIIYFDIYYGQHEKSKLTLIWFGLSAL